jgi:hypothetical protein
MSASLDMGLVATAFVLGFRHGFDWDHIAALGDIAASQSRRRRSIALATLYALGHAAVAFGIGAAVVMASARLSASIGGVMERVVGGTLVVLGAWVIVSHARGGNGRMASRGMLLLAAVRRFWRPRSEVVVIEHEHEHLVNEPHVHERDHERVDVGKAALAHGAATHRHRHTHVAALPDDPFPTYGGGVALGIGMLHGVGFETPTQALVFVTAAGAGSRAAGLLVLACFLAGLLIANTLVATASTLALAGGGVRGRLYSAASLLAAAASLALGILYMLGKGDVLPG